MGFTIKTTRFIALLGGLFMAIIISYLLKELIPNEIAIIISPRQLRPIDKDTLITIGMGIGLVLGYLTSKISIEITQHFSPSVGEDEKCKTD